MRPEKKAARRHRNFIAKEKKRHNQKSLLALVGKTVFEKEIPTGQIVDGVVEMRKVLDFPPFVRTAADGSLLPTRFSRNPNNIPARMAGYGSTSLLFIGMKQHPHHGAQSKTRPGNKELHHEAIVELHSRSLAVEIDKALVPEVVIGEFADHDPAVGAAIDHSIATGEPLFPEASEG